jgi:hypothetical protein
VHLDSPNTILPVPGKVYVACFVRKICINTHEQLVGSTVEVLAVDPWELLLLEGGRLVVTYVME